MYSTIGVSFRDRIGHKSREFFEDTRDHVACLKLDGEKSYRRFGGFTGNVHYAVKVSATGYTYFYPDYINFEGSLLGSWVNGTVYIVLPFRIHHLMSGRFPAFRALVLKTADPLNESLVEIPCLTGQNAS
jgi:hypothetical protein